MQRILIALLFIVCPFMALAEDAPDNIHNITGQEGYGSVEFYKFQFVEKPGAGEDDFTPVKEPGAAGKDVIGDASLLGKIDEIAFYAIDENGKKIEDLKLVPNFKGDHYRGHFTVPSHPFRVVAFGKDEDGKKFARVNVEWFRPK